jgi:hypothetical protein
VAEKTLQEEAGLHEGERLERLASRTTGYMGCDDVTEYTILNEDGKSVGTVRVTEHTNVKPPFHESRTVVPHRF